MKTTNDKKANLQSENKNKISLWQEIGLSGENKSGNLKKRDMISLISLMSMC